MVRVAARLWAVRALTPLVLRLLVVSVWGTRSDHSKIGCPLLLSVERVLLANLRRQQLLTCMLVIDVLYSYLLWHFLLILLGLLLLLMLLQHIRWLDKVVVVDHLPLHSLKLLCFAKWLLWLLLFWRVLESRWGSILRLELSLVERNVFCRLMRVCLCRWIEENLLATY